MTEGRGRLGNPLREFFFEVFGGFWSSKATVVFYPGIARDFGIQWPLRLWSSHLFQIPGQNWRLLSNGIRKQPIQRWNTCLVSSNMAGWKPWTIEISDFQISTIIWRGFSSHSCLMKPDSMIASGRFLSRQAGTISRRILWSHRFGLATDVHEIWHELQESEV